jgi:hypothetical protein
LQKQKEKGSRHQRFEEDEYETFCANGGENLNRKRDGRGKLLKLNSFIVNRLLRDPKKLIPPFGLTDSN